MLLVVGHTCFLCSCPDGIASLVHLLFWSIFSLFLVMVELFGLDWEVSALCSYIPRMNPPLEAGMSDLLLLEVYSSSSLASIGG